MSQRIVQVNLGLQNTSRKSTLDSKIPRVYYLKWQNGNQEVGMEEAGALIAFINLLCHLLIPNSQFPVLKVVSTYRCSDKYSSRIASQIRMLSVRVGEMNFLKR